MRLKISEEKHLYIAKKLFNLFVLIFFLHSCGLTQTQNEVATVNESNCEETRGAIDIGSGSTKLIVAVVNKCELKIVNILFEAQRAVALKEDLSRNGEKFSDEMIKKITSNLNELDYLARSQGATKIASLATSAFRTAKNSKQTVIEIEKNIEFKINVISQEEEAMHAYLAAKQMAPSIRIDQSKPLAVWDIGGGSMQIIKEVKDKRPIIYMGQTASVGFKNKYLQMTSSKAKTPNPLHKDGAITAMNLARKISNSETTKILKNLEGYEVLGVGGVHYYSVRKQTKTTDNSYDQEQLLGTLLERAKLSDTQIGGDFSQTDVTNIALVLGFMQSLKIEKVHAVNINMANGLLLDQNIWN